MPSSPDYGVVYVQLIRYAKACSSYDYFILSAVRLSNALLGQVYSNDCLKSYPRSSMVDTVIYLIKQDEISLSRMSQVILDDHIQCHTPLISH